MVLQALQSHDRRDLTIGNELTTQVEKRAQVRKRQIWCFVRVRLFWCRIGDIARWWATGHESVTGEGHVLIVGLSDRATA